MRSPISSGRRVLHFPRFPAEGPMRGNHGVWVATCATTLALGACSQSNAEPGSARGGAAATPPASAATPASDTGNRATAGTVIVPAEQVARLRVEPAAVSNFRPTIEATGTVQFDADVSTQVLAPISGPVTRILAEPGTFVRAGQALALVSSHDFATTVADFRKAQAAWVQAKRVSDLDEQ